MGTGLVPGAMADVFGQYLPPGPATPTRPWYTGTTRDIPWWFRPSNYPPGSDLDSNGTDQSDAVDIGTLWAARINAGGNPQGYEIAVINPPAPTGNGGAVGSADDLRYWPAGTPTTAGTFSTTWTFSVRYDWDPGTSVATASMTFTQGATTKNASADVTTRILAFVNGTSPYPTGLTHNPNDLLIRLATSLPGTTFSNMKSGVSNLKLSIDGGASQSVTFNNPGPTSSLTVSSSDGPGPIDEAVRQVGFIYIPNFVSGHTHDFELTGEMTFEYTRLTAGGPPSGAGLMFEAKFGDLTLVPEPATYALVAAVGLCGLGGWRRLRRRS